MAIILDSAPVLFKCTRCAALCESLVELLEHREDCQPMHAAALADSTAPTFALDLVHRTRRAVVSRAKARPVGEIELAPSEAVSSPPPVSNKESTPEPRKQMAPRPVAYCGRCGVALPVRPGLKCENCGRTLQ